jgi:hypothetical protein
MNVYTISVEPKTANNASLGIPYGGGYQLHIVTDTLQEAISIAKCKINNTEEITGIYIGSKDVIIDHTKIQSQTC